MTDRKRLTDLFKGTRHEAISQTWESTAAAPEYAPLPAGVYNGIVLSGELFEAKSGTPGYRLTLRINEGEYTGRQIWHDLWLTPLAMPVSKRDLAKLGISTIEALDTPLRAGIRCEIKLRLHRDDDGRERNKVRSFLVTGFDTFDDEVFAPTVPVTAPEGTGHE